MWFTRQKPVREQGRDQFSDKAALVAGACTAATSQGKEERRRDELADLTGEDCQTSMSSTCSRCDGKSTPPSGPRCGASACGADGGAALARALVRRSSRAYSRAGRARSRNDMKPRGLVTGTGGPSAMPSARRSSVAHAVRARSRGREAKMGCQSRTSAARKPVSSQRKGHMVMRAQ